ncbi:MAG: hypothetical protein EOM50_18670 [Erysipelotrichia bacterium]|nr:hypothetical protein [Erysipelotrichia bacterium]
MCKGIIMQHPKIPNKQENVSPKKEILDESTLSPRAKELLNELSLELGLSKEIIASLAKELYRLCKR